MARHRFTKNQRGQEIDASLKQKSAAQIRHQNKSSGQLATPLQDRYSVFIAEMMKRKRAKHRVVGLGRIPRQNIGLTKGNFRIAGAQLRGDFQSCRLSI